jgi:hypothetical protein
MGEGISTAPLFIIFIDILAQFGELGKCENRLLRKKIPDHEIEAAQNMAGVSRAE